MAESQHNRKIYFAHTLYDKPLDALDDAAGVTAFLEAVFLQTNGELEAFQEYQRGRRRPIDGLTTILSSLRHCITEASADLEQQAREAEGRRDSGAYRRGWNDGRTKLAMELAPHLPEDWDFSQPPPKPGAAYPKLDGPDNQAAPEAAPEEEKAAKPAKRRSGGAAS